MCVKQLKVRITAERKQIVGEFNCTCCQMNKSTLSFSSFLQFKYLTNHQTHAETIISYQMFPLACLLTAVQNSQRHTDIKEKEAVIQFISLFHIYYPAAQPCLKWVFGIQGVILGLLGEKTLEKCTAMHTNSTNGNITVSEAARRGEKKKKSNLPLSLTPFSITLPHSLSLCSAATTFQQSNQWLSLTRVRVKEISSRAIIATN